MIYKAVTQERAHRLLRLGIVPINNYYSDMVVLSLSDC